MTMMTIRGCSLAIRPGVPLPLAMARVKARAEAAVVAAVAVAGPWMAFYERSINRKSGKGRQDSVHLLYLAHHKYAGRVKRWIMPVMSL